jgi:hypothetical protein
MKRVMVFSAVMASLPVFAQQADAPLQADLPPGFVHENTLDEPNSVSPNVAYMMAASRFVVSFEPGMNTDNAVALYSHNTGLSEAEVRTLGVTLTSVFDAYEADLVAAQNALCALPAATTRAEFVGNAHVFAVEKARALDRLVRTIKENAPQEMLKLFDEQTANSLDNGIHKIDFDAAAFYDANGNGAPFRQELCAK